MQVPALGGDFAYAVPAVQEVFPELLEIDCPGIAAADTDDSDSLVLVRHGDVGNGKADTVILALECSVTLHFFRPCGFYCLLKRKIVG